MVVGSGEEEAVEVRSGDSEKVMAKKEGCGSVMRWERFLPRMVLRVLLVEADDSTRQIIAALLRKCNYKVVAVPDGLKAWEVLKGRPQNIDIILTEVELPSISGYALLTLIMEHEICKNIPVIMMSSNDSISTVYKCMLRGAADFLVKPIRKNELRNMWQHVWRRRSSTIDKNGPNNESVEEKVEATAENATSDHLSGYKACGQGNKECNEKGSDAQSSCTKPDMEAESSYMANMQDLSQPNWSRSLASDMKLQMQGQDVISAQELLTQKIDACGLALSAPRVDNTSSWNNSLELERQRESHNNSSEACENNDLLLNSSRKAIDLIGSFDNYKKISCRSSSSNNDKNKFEFLPRLDLSLRRAHNDGSENQTDEKHTLNHSNASAFSRYVNTTLQPLCLAPVNVCSQKYQTGSDQHSLTHAAGYNSEPSGSTLNAQKSIITMATGQFGQTETVLPSPHDRAFPVAAPVPSINFDGLSSGLGSVQPATFNDQSGPSSIQSPSSATHQDGAVLVNQHQPRDETIDSEHPFESVQISNNLSQTIPKEDDKVEPLDDRANFSSVTGQSASSRFCNGTASHLNSIACGSICGSNDTINLASICKTNAEGCTEEGLSLHNENCYRSQREAALMKFRLKRKDRCFEKKVRYESRKKLAEQRPRVKGQFVRQLNTEPTPQEMVDCSGNSLDG